MNKFICSSAIAACLLLGVPGVDFFAVSAQSTALTVSSASKSIRGEGSVKFELIENDLSTSCSEPLPKFFRRGPRGKQGPSGPTGATGPVGPAGPTFNQYASAFNANGVFTEGNLLFTPDSIQGITYDETTGVFSINATGIYQIMICSTPSAQDGGVFQLLVNNTSVGAPLTLSGIPGPASMTIIRSLTEGDTIALGVVSSASYSAQAASMTINQIN